MQKTQGYLEKREERRDSVPPLRTDSHRNVGQTRSRSVSRTRSYRPRAETPKPPPAPARAPVTPPQGPTAASKPVRYKAAPVSLKQPSGPKSSSSAQPPVKGTTGSTAWKIIRFNTTAKHSTRSARSTENSTAVEREIAAGRTETDY